MTLAWFRWAPARLEWIRRDLAKYPELRIEIEKETLFIRGSLPIVDGDAVLLDRFQVEIEFPVDYPQTLPAVRETENRIPRTADTHHMNPDGTCCVGVPLTWYLRPESREFVAFLEGPVRDYFLRQALLERGQPWPHGERSHGGEGIAEACREVFQGAEDGLIERLLTAVAGGRLKGRKPCPCGSNRRLRDCHPKLLELQSAVPRAVLESTLLNWKSRKPPQ